MLAYGLLSQSGAILGWFGDNPDSESPRGNAGSTEVEFRLNAAVQTQWFTRSLQQQKRPGTDSVNVGLAMRINDADSGDTVQKFGLPQRIRRNAEENRRARRSVVPLRTASAVGGWRAFVVFCRASGIFSLCWLHLTWLSGGRNGPVRLTLLSAGCLSSYLFFHSETGDRRARRPECSGPRGESVSFFIPLHLI
jgi:hypothetical protein